MLPLAYTIKMKYAERKDKPTSIRIPEGFKKILQERAKEQGVTLSVLANVLMMNFVLLIEPDNVKGLRERYLEKHIKDGNEVL